MPTTRPIATGPVASLVGELADLLKLAKVAARMQLEKAAPPGWSMPDEGGIVWPRFKNEEEYRLSVEAIGDVPQKLTQEAEALVELVQAITDEVGAFTAEPATTKEEIRSRSYDLDVQWRCAQFTSRRRAIDMRLRMLHALLAELYCSLERVYSNIELIYVCPPHPCDDPYVPSDDFRLSGAFAASQAYERSETAEGEEAGEPAPRRRATRRRQSRE